jgi:hypothetical protein
MSPQSSYHPVDIASCITLRWTCGHSVLSRALGTGLVAERVADAGRGGLKIRIIAYARRRQVFDLRSIAGGKSPLGKQRLSEMTTA